MYRLIALFGLLLAFAGMDPAVALAQEATPAAGRDVPAPEECTVEPRSAESLTGVFATPAAGTPMAERTPPAVPFGAPDGEAADPATAEAVTAVVRQEWACVNANDFPRLLALYTDDLIRRVFSPEDIEAMTGASVNALGTVTPGTPEPVPPAEQTALIAVLDVEVLGEGRAGAFVLVDAFGDPLPVEVNYYLLAEADGEWLIDDFICFDAVGQLC